MILQPEYTDAAYIYLQCRRERKKEREREKDRERSERKLRENGA